MKKSPKVIVSTRIQRKLAQSFSAFTQKHGWKKYLAIEKALEDWLDKMSKKDAA